MTHPFRPALIILALASGVGLAGVAQAAPTAIQPQPTTPAASDGKAAHSFFCNMEPAAEVAPATSVDRTPASGGDKDKDRGRGKKGPVSPSPSSTLLQQQTKPNQAAPQ